MVEPGRSDDDAANAPQRPCPLAPIGWVRSPWPAKFGVPRQAGLAAVETTVALDPARCLPEALRGLLLHSHVWVLTWMHVGPAIDPQAPPPAGTVRPPRLGGNARLGVFATRSPFRPHPIGLSAARLLAVDERALTLRVVGLDAVDGTPVLDVKPYVPWCDRIPAAQGPWPAPVAALEVSMAPAAAAALAQLGDAALTQAREAAIVATLAWDPRPAYRAARDDPGPYALAVAGVDVTFVVHGHACEVTDVRALAP